MISFEERVWDGVKMRRGEGAKGRMGEMRKGEIIKTTYQNFVACKHLIPCGF